MSWIHNLIKIDESEDQDFFIKARLFIRTTIIFSIVGVLYGTLYITSLNFIVGAKFLYLMSVLNILGLAIFYVSQNLRVSGNYLGLMLCASLIFLSYNSGGLFASSNSWFSILVLVSLLIAGFRSAIFWGLISLIYLGILVYLAKTNYAFPSLYAPGTEVPRQLIGFGGGVILTYILAIIFEQNKRAAYQYIDLLLENTVAKLETTQIDISKTVVETAQKASHCAEYSIEVTNRFSEMNKAIQQINDNLILIVNHAKSSQKTIQIAEELTQNNSERVHQLMQKSREIEKISDIIRSITSQVNLLSLNASVEAARAGSAGISFAVVANEIKNLSLQTTESTVSIEKTLNSIQSEIGGVSNDLKHLNKIITEISSNQVQITKSVEIQTDVTLTMREAVQLSTNQGLEITNLIQQLSELANSLLVKTTS